VAEPVCITCGESVGEPYRLNRLQDGRICPTCRDRVLAALPPIFPRRTSVAEKIEATPVAGELDDPPTAS